MRPEKRSKRALLLPIPSDLDALKITVGIRIYPETDLAATAVAEGVIAPGRRSASAHLLYGRRAQGLAACENCRLQGLALLGNVG